MRVLETLPSGVDITLERAAPCDFLVTAAHIMSVSITIYSAGRSDDGVNWKYSDWWALRNPSTGEQFGRASSKELALAKALSLIRDKDAAITANLKKRRRDDAAEAANSRRIAQLANQAASEWGV